MSPIQIAIDGPAGSGKSTVAKIIAERLGITYLDTGAMYRAVTLFAIEKGIELKENVYLNEIVDTVSIDFVDHQVLVNGINCSKDIRSERVTKWVSLVSKDPYVRREMVIQQRKIAEGKSVVMDGRDIGTQVLPDAKYKFFLVADINERAKRRLDEQNKQKDAHHSIQSLEEMIEEINRRDIIDSNREIAPLKQAKDAILIDTTAIDIEKVVQKIIEHIDLSELDNH